MPQSPKRPYSLAEGRIHIWGGAGEDDQGGSGADNGSGSGDAGKSDEPTPEQKALKEAEDKAVEADKKAKESEKRAKDAEKALKDKELEGADEQQKVLAERDSLKEQNEKLLKLVETSVIDSTIANLSNAKDKQGNPKYSWQDIEAVRAFVKRDDIDIDLDTGEVSGIDTQLKDIASKRPYLLVSKEEQDLQNGNTPPPPPGGPATGSHPTGGSARQRETDRTKLGSKYKLPGFVGISS